MTEPPGRETAATGLWRWLAPSVPPRLSAAAREAVWNLLAPLPADCSDLVGWELAGDGVPVHVNVAEQRLDSFAAVWPDAAPLVAAAANGLGAIERGVVFEELGDGGYRPAAVYSGRPSAGGARLADLLELWRVPGETRSLVAGHPALRSAGHVGIHVQRPGRPLRLVVPVAATDEAAWNSLSALPGLGAETAASAAAFAARIRPEGTVLVNVDVVAGRCGPLLGVEVEPTRAERRFTGGLWSDSAPQSPPDPDRSALRTWQGRRLLHPDGSPVADGDLLAVARDRGGLMELRLLNHVKVAFRAGGAMATKLYLSVSRAPATWVPAAAG